MTSKVWFITGASKGFGRIWAEAALARGDRVAATARDVSTLDGSGRKVRRRHRRAAARRQRQVGRRCCGRRGAQALRPPRRRHQQCRLRPVRRHRGGQRGRRPRPDRDQRLRRALGHAGGAADHARPEVGPYHPDLVDRRRQRLRPARPLSRLEMGARRASARRSARRSRISASTSPSSSPAAIRPTGPARRPRPPGRSTPMTRRASTAPKRAAGRSRAIPRRPARPCSPSSTPKNRRCASSSAMPACR